MLTDDLITRPLFAGLAPDQVERLAPLFQLLQFEPGFRIFGQGSPAEWVYVLETGAVGLRLHPEDGGCLTIGEIVPGGLFGWSAVLGRPRYTSAAICLSPVTALAVRGADLRAAIHADAQFGRVLLGRMAEAAAGRTGDARGEVTRLILNEMTQGSL